MLIAHIIFALSSLPLMLAAAINEFFGLVKNKKILPRLSAVSFVGMLSTGSILVVTSHQALLGPCIEGLAYLGAISGLYVAGRYLSKRSIQSE